MSEEMPSENASGAENQQESTNELIERFRNQPIEQYKIELIRKADVIENRIRHVKDLIQEYDGTHGDMSSIFTGRLGAIGRKLDEMEEALDFNLKSVAFMKSQEK
ncbi:MAG: hypothetical protein A3H57_02585 [Candidatus Taylorbacteria bacterium RIFCSPLOWO2_02_FULL_43_11]|uniref:Uncharacterized protein n=1 Tax=Candidatus Taylorbacteria bacterium RIFCSPHIGHO2_02_FULL_43_32b TaxID=1802306 RepID=A0A1G2MFW7_9BACT|nr:MAG: hypothetical protein A2743_00335 [Candidatus Taylorbacteria bacterium RIFCSPHIGHO2_01_FULL_43_47]OHA22815.1 MAG: hypothetical protein A3C72_02780 [Candidatus Taylorbacteria bacterium RIFCSPHIGHO2_02_FULL_43_32b]OHA30869.1 MAG: hypothetical protein A3B08_01585 [Candidatus Taylorbacteria bacterium RIFCSPLOWO2_01_FULL_43_44]OHA35266.1 MAG: hypothetical protein A3H57_02585 [Candidatus Taylorbacteria bacterium RIFCSPLOWO2_02_FULL_43_11]